MPVTNRKSNARSSKSGAIGAGARNSNRSVKKAGREAGITAKNVNANDRKFLEKYGNKLSKSTLRAKWIHSPDEREDRPGADPGHAQS